MRLRFAPDIQGTFPLGDVCVKVRHCYIRSRTGIESGKLSCEVALFNDLSKKEKSVGLCPIFCSVTSWFLSFVPSLEVEIYPRVAVGEQNTFSSTLK